MKAILAALSGFAIAMAAPAAAEIIKLGTIAPKGTPWYDGLRDMGEAWRDASNGGLRLRIYPGGVIGDESAMVRKMRIGQLQAAALSGGGLADIAPEIRVLMTPMLFASTAEATHVRQGVASKLERIIEDNGFKVLNWGDAGWLRIFAKRPVIRPADIRAIKVFAWAGNTVIVQAYKDAGLRPVPLPATEIHTALQSGLIDAILVPPLAALSFQWFGQARHMTKLDWVPLVGAVVITTRAWRKMPERLRPRLAAAAVETGATTQRAVAALDIKAVAVMKKHGLVVHAVPDDAIPGWRRLAESAYDRYLGAVAKSDLYAEVIRLRDQFRRRRDER